MTNSLVERLKRFTSFGCGQDDWPALRHDLIEALQPQSPSLPENAFEQAKKVSEGLGWPPSLMGSEGVELPHHVKQFLMSLDDGETHMFDDEDWGRPAQDAENLGLGYVTVWKQGWEFRLNDTGQKAMAALQSQPSVIRTEGEKFAERIADWKTPEEAASTVRDDALEEHLRRLIDLVEWLAGEAPLGCDKQEIILKAREALRSTPTALSPAIAPPDPVARQMAEALRNMVALAEPHFTSAPETLALNESVNALNLFDGRAGR